MRGYAGVCVDVCFGYVWMIAGERACVFAIVCVCVGGGEGEGVCVCGCVCRGGVCVCVCGVVGGLMGFMFSVFNFSAIDL